MSLLQKSIQFESTLIWPESHIGFSRSTSIETLMAWSSIQKCEWPFIKNTEKIGLYGGFTNGPLYQHEKFHPESNDSFNQSKIHKTIWPPKQHFRQLGPIKLSHISLLLKFKGPMYCATDINTAASDAYYIALCDLKSGHVDQALVVFGHAPNDKNNNEKAVGGALLLDKSLVHQKANYSFLENSLNPGDNFYGHCTALVREFFNEPV